MMSRKFSAPVADEKAQRGTRMKHIHAWKAAFAASLTFFARRHVIILTLTSFAWLATPYSFAAEKSGHVLMAAVGDSLSAATLADTSLSVPTDPLGNLLWRLFEHNHFIFDGIMSGDALYTNRYTLSWSTGTDVQSHYRRLKQWLDGHSADTVQLDRMNVAIPGGMSETLQGQMEKVVDRVNSEGYDSLALVTVSIGADDACADHLPGVIPNEVFKENLRKAFRTLGQLQQAEPIRVLLVSIPRAPDTGKRYIRHAFTWGLLHCGFVRRHLATYCTRLTSWNTLEEYRTLMTYVEDKNLALAEIAQEISGNPAYGHLELYFSPVTFENRVIPEELAADCFHPNYAGQEKMAEKLWDDQPWFK
jgi:lysophospholipase L1-like esterase